MNRDQPAASPRLAPVAPEQWDDEVHAALQRGFLGPAADHFLGGGADAVPLPNAVTTLLHHPRLAGPWLAYNGVLLFEAFLSPRLRELMILRVAWRTRSMYEWAQHVRIATGCGITLDEVDAIGRGAHADGWTPLEADVLAATDQLMDGYRIDDATWSRLAGHLDERQLVEVVFVVGTYTCLAMAFNSFGLELDPGLDAHPMPPRPETED